MRAVVYDSYGSPDVLELRSVAIPTIEPDQLLVRVRAAGLNPFDWHYLRGLPYLVRLVNGLRRPRASSVIGSDMAGVVEAVGSATTNFQPGDDVLAEVGTGACAEFAVVAADRAVRMPAELTFAEAAAIPMAAGTAVQGVREKGRVTSGDRVLVNGASGGVGTFAVQIAKALGADVTGVCSAANAELVASLGADRVIDYGSEDFTRGDERYDVILDTVGNRSLSECRRVLAPRGVYGATGGGGGRWLGPLMPQLKAVVLSPFVKQTLAAVNDQPNEDIEFINELIEIGHVRPVIDRTYGLDETAEAVRYLEAGHARGKVVVTI